MLPGRATPTAPRCIRGSRSLSAADGGYACEGRAVCLAPGHVGRDGARTGPADLERDRPRPLERDGCRRAAAWGDVVLARKDTPTSYHLAVVVDDAAQGVTHVVRGQDLFWSTSVHRLLQELLGVPAPAYHHHRLILDADGRKLSKSTRATALAVAAERRRDPGRHPPDGRSQPEPCGRRPLRANLPLGVACREPRTSAGRRPRAPSARRADAAGISSARARGDAGGHRP